MSHEIEAKELMRERRRRADGWMRGWARERERIGAGALGPTAKIKEMGDGAGARSTVGGSMNAIEAQCDRLERTIRIERWVREMPAEWIEVVVGVYLAGETQDAVAARLGVERNRVVSRVQDVLERIAYRNEAQAAMYLTQVTGRSVNADAVLTSACRPVHYEHLGTARPKVAASGGRPA